jgi:Phosphate-induced protein 1 conserved region
MRKRILTLLLMIALATRGNAQSIKHATHMVPNGKGWGEQSEDLAPGEAAVNQSVITGNGISYHGGPVMPGTVNVYFIWYGNWTNGPHASDSQTTKSLIDILFDSGGMGGSGYALINSTYGDSTHNVTGDFVLAASTTNNYSKGKQLSDSAVQSVVSSAITSHALPSDTNGIYFVLTSSDVTETSGFCLFYCGWHKRATIAGADIKYAFVGNPDRCPSACEAQTKSPNGDSGADAMASIMAHETEEAISDPDLNAWYDSSGSENADKCAWKFGPTTGRVGSGAYNQTFGGHNWLIQMNWENARKGGCDQKKGGTFYNF